MTKGWHRESRRHSLASRGIKTATDKATAINKVPPISREQKISSIIEKLNESKFRDNGIKNVSFAKRLMDERMSDEKLNDEVFTHLSKDKSSEKLFRKQLSDPTLPIVFVDTEFLSERKGNRLNLKLSDTGAFGKSVEKITILINKNKELSDVPFYNMKSQKVGEGNHRVEALKQLGYKSVPVRLINSWD